MSETPKKDAEGENSKNSETESFQDNKTSY